jgi:hypothetical protein
LVVENQGEGIHWMEPRDLRFDAMDPSFNSARGISSPYVAPAVVTVDGEIHRLKPTLSAETLRALLTPNGGEILERDAASGWVTLPDGRLRGLAKNSSPDR